MKTQRYISNAEYVISDKEDRGAFFGKRKYSDLSFVYFIIHKNNIIYIGCTKNPHSREECHFNRLKEKRIKNYTITFYGPYFWRLALDIESAEIAKRTKSKYLLNKSCKNKQYDKKFSIENYRQKSISFIRKGSKIEPLVG